MKQLFCNSFIEPSGQTPKEKMGKLRWREVRDLV